MASKWTLCIRHDPGDLLAGGILFHQLIVHVYSSVLLNAFYWYRQNSDQFRHDQVSGAADAMAQLAVQNRYQGSEGRRPLHIEIGRKSVLSPSFLGGDSYMRQLLFDMMALVGRYRHPLFHHLHG